MLWRRKNREWGTEDASTAGVIVLKNMAREGFSEMLIFEQRHTEIWWEDQRKSKSKSHGVAACLAHSCRVTSVMAESRNEVKRLGWGRGYMGTDHVEL